MKNIPLSSLPNFQGMVVEDPDTFLFEFDVLCKSYDYNTDAQKLKLFLATLKGEALRWFMGLCVSTIRDIGRHEREVSFQKLGLLSY